MSITTSFGICQSSNCSSLTFNETTGAYSAGNPNGYGTPNDTNIGGTALLIISLSRGTSYTLSLTSSGFPSSDKTKEFIINATDIGYPSGSKIADQIITFQYIVTTALGTVIKQWKQTAFYCQANCCVSSMFIDLDTDCEDCDKARTARAIKANLMLQGLKYSANCIGNDPSTFNKTLTQLNKLCNNSKCSSCDQNT